MEWKINKLSSRIVKVIPHTALESVVIHLFIGALVGWLTYLGFQTHRGMFAYFGLTLTLIFLIIILFDIYTMIMNYKFRKQNAQADKTSK